jgi:hypothetical protein
MGNRQDTLATAIKVPPPRSEDQRRLDDYLNVLSDVLDGWFAAGFDGDTLGDELAHFCTWHRKQAEIGDRIRSDPRIGGMERGDAIQRWPEDFRETGCRTTTVAAYELAALALANEGDIAEGDR